MAIAPRTVPRISVNDLAQFMVSSDTARMGIIKRAKSPQMPPILRYKDVRQPVCAFLTDRRRVVNPLAEAERMFRQRAEDTAISPLKRDDARASIDVLRAVQGLSNQLGPFDFHAAPAKQNKLQIGGIEVSVRADLIVHGSSRGKDHIGAAILRLTQGINDSEAGAARRRDMGLYVATLARMHVEENLPLSDREPANRLCLAIDVQQGEVIACPTAYARRQTDIENACRFIAAMWPTS